MPDYTVTFSNGAPDLRVTAGSVSVADGLLEFWDGEDQSGALVQQVTIVDDTGAPTITDLTPQAR